MIADLPFPAPRFERRRDSPKTGVRTQGRAADSAAPGLLYCRNCHRAVTDESQRVAIAGVHEHTRTNPHGMTFHFGCFAEAPGCAAAGRATAEHSWFAGCRWRVAICRGCGDHLGWLFTGADRFFGLILARLAAESGRRV